MDSSIERRRFERRPIRLKIAYQTARSLVVEYAKSVSKGGLCFSTRTPLPPGAVFVFELRAPGLPDAVEVAAEVVRAEFQAADGLYEMEVRYALGEDQGPALDRALQAALGEGMVDDSRRHERVTLDLPARDARDGSTYRVRDLSPGGMGIEVPAPASQARLATGTPVLVTVELEGDGRLDIGGEVAWACASATAQGALAGIQFEQLTDEERARLEELTRRRRPTSLRLTFLAA